MRGPATLIGHELRSGAPCGLVNRRVVPTAEHEERLSARRKNCQCLAGAAAVHGINALLPVMQRGVVGVVRETRWPAWQCRSSDREWELAIGSNVVEVSRPTPIMAGGACCHVVVVWSRVRIGVGGAVPGSTTAGMP